MEDGGEAAAANDEDNLPQEHQDGQDLRLQAYLVPAEVQQIAAGWFVLWVGRKNSQVTEAEAIGGEKITLVKQDCLLDWTISIVRKTDMMLVTNDISLMWICCSGHDDLPSALRERRLEVPLPIPEGGCMMTGRIVDEVYHMARAHMRRFTVAAKVPVGNQLVDIGQRWLRVAPIKPDDEPHPAEGDRQVVTGKESLQN